MNELTFDRKEFVNAWVASAMKSGISPYQSAYQLKCFEKVFAIDLQNEVDLIDPNEIDDIAEKYFPGRIK